MSLSNEFPLKDAHCRWYHRGDNVAGYSQINLETRSGYATSRSSADTQWYEEEEVEMKEEEEEEKEADDPSSLDSMLIHLLQSQWHH